MREQRQISGKVQLASLKGRLETVDELAAKHPPEHGNGEKEARVRSNPAGVIERELLLSKTPTIEVTEVHEQGSDLIVGKTREIPQLIKSPVGEGFPMDVAKDGRILAITRGQDNRTQLVVVSNWEAGLKK